MRHYKLDKRPKKGSWAPGEYVNQCPECKEYFIGDKLALFCADCAYGAELNKGREI